MKKAPKRERPYSGGDAILVDMSLNLDFKLLRKQKLSLVEMHDSEKDIDIIKYKEHIDGIIGLIDGVQDAAILDGLTQFQVFGKKKAEK